LDSDDRKRLWLEYLFFVKRANNENLLLEIADEALLDVSPEVYVPILTPEPHFVVRSQYTSVTSPTRLLDFSFHNQVLEVLVAGINVMQRVGLLYDRALAMFPKNADLYTRASEHEQKAGNFKKAKAILKAAVRNCPDSVDCWKMLSQLEGQREDTAKIRQVFKQATAANPINSSLWITYKEFEEKQKQKQKSTTEENAKDETDDNAEKVEHLAMERGVECGSTVQL